MFKKALFVGVLAFSLVFSSTAFADTRSDLQAQIDAILVQIKQLQAQLNSAQGGSGGGGASPVTVTTSPVPTSPPSQGGGGGGGSTPVGFCYNWTNNLRVGDRGSAVDALVTALVREGFIPNPSNGRIYGEDFNEQVASAVVGFQEKYASEILTPNNLSRGTGFVGVSTRAKLNRLYGCGSGTITPSPVVNPPQRVCAVGAMFSSITGLPCSTVPTPTNSITVLSPNGGESWARGTTQTIKWQDSYTGCVTNSTGATACVDSLSRLYDINLVSYHPPCTGICPAYPYILPYTIATAVSGSSYDWKVGNTKGDALASDGYYTVQICQTGTNTCDSSDSYFKITSATVPPTPTNSIISYSVKTDKQIYTSDEKINIKIDAVNSGPQPQTLNFNSGCQVAYTVASYSPIQTCSLALTAVTIPAYGVKTWTLIHSPDQYKIPPGSYKLSGEVLGYGEATTPVTITSSVTPSSITVLSPNGGESWAKGTTQTIKWQDNIPWSMPYCPPGNTCPQMFTQHYFDIKLAPYYPPCTGQICPAYPYILPYTIATAVSGTSHDWKVGSTKGDALVSDGYYTVQICQTGTNTCDSSDSYFKITSDNTSN